MRAALLLVGALMSVGVVGLAAGEALGLCTPTTLPSPQAEIDAVQDYDPSLTLLAPVQDLDLGSEYDTHACAGQIRPGARQTVGCTMSWVFTDQNGAFYQTTAGHCTSSLGQVVGISGLGNIGTVVYRVNGGIGNDIALVRIDPAMYHLVNPTLCHWGGPNGIATPATTGTNGQPQDAMLHYGWGVMWSDQETRARAGYINGNGGSVQGSGWFADGSVRMRGLTDGGDSGSPMMLKSGLAAGVHTHRLDSAPQGYGLKAASRLDLHIPRIEAALGLDLEIAQGAPVDVTGLTIQD